MIVDDDGRSPLDHLVLQGATRLTPKCVESEMGMDMSAEYIAGATRLTPKCVERAP